jgi:Pentapeptide repeats (8 copies)
LSVSKETSFAQLTELISNSYCSSMSTPERTNFSDQPLRDRSFRRQMLRGAVFCNADIRGCDFSGADLTGANFAGAIAGQTLRQRIVWVSVAIAVLLLAGHAVSRSGFGSLGQTPSDPAWRLVVALSISLSLAGGLSGVRVWLKGWLRQWAKRFSGIISGAFLGFFYAGIVAEWLDPKMSSQGLQAWAIAGAVGGSVVLAILSRWAIPVIAIFTSMAGAITSYGFALLMGATAIAFLSTLHTIGGVLLLALSALYLWLTVNSLAIVLHEVRHSPGTRFVGATLTHANFANTKLHHTDFSNAIGLETPLLD